MRLRLELVREGRFEVLQVAARHDRDRGDQRLRAEHVVAAVDLVTDLDDVTDRPVNRRRADAARRGADDVVQSSLDLLLDRYGAGTIE